MRRHADFQKAFDPGRTLNHPTGPLTLEVERLGALQITSGRIGICEPYSLPTDLRPLRRHIPSGVYPALGSIAVAEDGGRRVAACRLLLGDEPPERWEVAVAEHWQPEDTPPGTVPGFDTDCAMLCLADPEAGPVPDFDEVFERLDVDPPPQSAPLRGSRDATPWLAVETGFGDGTYPAWWGIDAQGKVSTLDLDFMVLWRTRQKWMTVPVNPLDPGPVTSDTLAEVGCDLEVLMAPWPGFTLGIQLSGPGGDPKLFGPDGAPLATHRTQARGGVSRRYVFTSTRLLPTPVHLRLAMGTEQEPL